MHHKAKDLTRKVFELIQEDWPSHPSGICRRLEIPLTVKNIARIKYHFDILSKQGKIHTKKIDRALVAWPSEIEKIRVMHEFLKDI
ncbi:MAG: hypothetical protein QXG00_00610 [Candidatus Woesearchaeota archaeon]